MSTLRDVVRRIGPGLITASVVLGPGSIVASSKAGAEGGYRLVWLIAVAGLFMAVYVSMGARLGCALEDSPLTYVSRRAGRWLAVLAGLSAFLVTAGFQFGNNLGVAFAVSGITGTPAWVWPLVFTGLSLLFLFTAKRVYVWLERIMMAMVGIMIVCFFANLFWTGFDVAAFANGLVPRLAKPDWLVAPAMLATTFSVVAAFYQAYLVQAKGWHRENVRDAVLDGWVGIAILALISGAIMVGAAQTLHGTEDTFWDVGQLAQLLKGLLGPAANAVFCCGIAAASFSSFIVNAIVGGGMMADGLGLDARVDSAATKKLSAAVMVLGCVVALLILLLGKGSAQSLLVAQASTLVAIPLCAVLLYYLTCSKKVMGDMRNRAFSLVLGAAGLLLLLGISVRTLVRLFS